MALPCKLVRFTSDEVGSLRLRHQDHDELVNVGIPADVLSRFVAAPNLSPLATDGRQLIILGYTGLQGRICLDRASGGIFQVVAPGEPEIFVNTSLAHFRATGAALLSSFPFHASGAELKDREEAAQRIGAIIEGIDPLAMDLDQLWSTLVDDIAIGDLDEEIVLSPAP
jgi:hypothetical protein